ncbi:hypothetical protein PPL_05587 [Heterostelium album PN500]|uniref:Transmembrane protein n=1 Tax=Heterostelium pallidum (strain ATCC 26659 / Pp 5 / PN500) TaxID=670386 RepID=D3BAK9_HETP5|nr:hypothetical protein PPL_05587 [Heterostelium album PN500]EFA81596.1 hypothetical protein PPL_05587 [Heterostelium album PN500]|eukprot:XP_020433713.1 hypothetical protein PPL_05587 [Heterostelium album PN500]
MARTSGSGKKSKKSEDVESDDPQEEEVKKTTKRSKSKETNDKESSKSSKSSTTSSSSKSKSSSAAASSSSSKKKPSVVVPEPSPKTNFVSEIEDDDDENLPYGLSDSDNDDDYDGEQKHESIVSSRSTKSNGLQPEYEELFYTPKKRHHRKGSRDNNKDDDAEDNDLMYKRPVGQAVTLLQYYDQTVNYTREMLEQLSRQIRRHPMLAARSYRFLHKGLTTKIRHQKIQVAISGLLALSLIALYIFSPLPSVHRFELSPTSPTMQEDKSSPVGFDDDFDLPLQQHNHTAFKENWARFSVVGISNYLCGNYNFNPIMDAMMPPGDELHNVRIFGSALFAGVVLFVLWLCATRLAEREIILDSGLAGQITHGILTIVVIPIASSAFWALLALYFTQTMVVSSGVPNVTQGKEDIFKCVSKLSNGMQELMTFSPIRELLVGAVGTGFARPCWIAGRGNGANLSHVVSGDRNSDLLSHYDCIIDLHDLPRQQSSQSSIAVQQAAVDRSRADHYRSEITTVVPSRVTVILLAAAFALWIFGLPKWRVHEGEAFYVFLALMPLIKAVYNLIVIDQRKQKIPNPQPHLQTIIDEDVEYD